MPGVVSRWWCCRCHRGVTAGSSSSSWRWWWRWRWDRRARPHGGGAANAIAVSQQGRHRCRGGGGLPMPSRRGRRRLVVSSSSWRWWRWHHCARPRVPGVVSPIEFHAGVAASWWGHRRCLEGCDSELVVWVTKVLWDLVKISTHLVLYSYTSVNLALTNLYGVTV